ncbi:unnamed protein product [Rotaria sp. Silwood1]|nr:unnamed protein product [Rotaria sp. Silwood1]
MILDVVKPLIRKQLVSKKLLYKPCAVVIGRSGAGKTTLINAICRTQHELSTRKGSISRNLYRNDVGCGRNMFSLIDMPEIDSSPVTYKHTFLLREALSATKINTIFIVIKYDSRFGKMIENYFELEQLVYNYGRKIIVIISHWDQSKNPQKNYKEICNLFEDECPNVTNLIFYSEQNYDTEVANLMYSCISNMKEERLNINDENFFFKSNIYQMKSQTKILFQQYQSKANLLEQEYTQLINSIKSSFVEDKDEALHLNIVQFKIDMEVLLQEFRQEYTNAMKELDYYVFNIKMEKENVRICDEFLEKVVSFMSYNLFDNQDPRNLIKRCPNCKLIWFKTEGCDGVTTCGNKIFTNHQDVKSKAFWKYNLQRINGKLQLVKNNMETKALLKAMHINSNSNRIGCGIEFKWSELPKIEDHLILQLFTVETIDQAKQLIQAGSYREP